METELSSDVLMDPWSRYLNVRVAELGSILTRHHSDKSTEFLLSAAIAL